jgi:hypothetical protein
MLACPEVPAADILGKGNVVTKPSSVTKEQLIARLWELAAIPPEKTRGNLKGQISACNTAYCTFGYEPALGRLGELASIDPARTRGRRRDQESATKLLKRLLSSLRADKSGVQ